MNENNAVKNGSNSMILPMVACLILAVGLVIIVRDDIKDDKQKIEEIVKHDVALQEKIIALEARVSKIENNK